MYPMKPIDTSIFDFPTLIANGYVYDDVKCERAN